MGIAFTFLSNRKEDRKSELVLKKIFRNKHINMGKQDIINNKAQINKRETKNQTQTFDWCCKFE